MYDIHCHILPGVDDGPSAIEDSLEIISIAEQAGIKAIVCTPHYMKDKYKNSSDNNMTILNSFKKAVELKGVGIQIYLGNEVFIDQDMINLLDTKAIVTLNNSRYILVEMPVYSKPLFADELMFKLELRGLVPVIAHPERYEWVSRNPRELSNMIDRGCLTQLNISSISGYYGKGTEKTAKALIRENHIHLLGSDSHAAKKIYDNFSINLRNLKKLSSEYMVEWIIHNNEAVINNIDVKFSP